MKQLATTISLALTQDVNWKRVKILSTTLGTLLLLWAVMEITFRVLY